MNRKELIIFIIILLAIGTGIFAYQKSMYEQPNIPIVGEDKKIKVVASFYPLEHFAKQVGGENIELRTLTQTGGEPHDYEPTPQDIITIKNADIFVFNGAGFEPWAEKLTTELQKEGVKVIEMSNEVDLIAAEDPGHEEEAGEEEEHGEFDPHIWLDPIRVQKQVEILRDAFIEKDTEHANVYRSNAVEYINELKALDTAYKQDLTQCAKEEVVVSHNAFAYLADRYDFGIHAIAGFSPTEEPSAKHLAELTKLVKTENIKYIFTETLASPKFSDTLARETGAQTLVLNPVEGLTDQEREQKKTYDSLMRENLENLRLALECK